MTLVHPHGGQSVTNPLQLPKRLVSHIIHYTNFHSRHIVPLILTAASSYIPSCVDTPAAIFFFYYLSSRRHTAILFSISKLVRSSSATTAAPYSTTHSLTPWCRLLPQQLTGLQLVKIFPTFYRTRRFITVLTSVRHLSLSWASPIQYMGPHTHTYIHKKHYQLCKLLYIRLLCWTFNSKFEVHRAVYRNIIYIVKPTRCTIASLYFGLTLYMFRTVFPSIFRSSRLYLQQQAFVRQTLLSAG